MSFDIQFTQNDKASEKFKQMTQKVQNVLNNVQEGILECNEAGDGGPNILCKISQINKEIRSLEFMKDAVYPWSNFDWNYANIANTNYTTGSYFDVETGTPGDIPLMRFDANFDDSGPREIRSWRALEDMISILINTNQPSDGGIEGVKNYDWTAFIENDSKSGDPMARFNSMLPLNHVPLDPAYDDDNDDPGVKEYYNAQIREALRGQSNLSNDQIEDIIANRPDFSRMDSNDQNRLNNQVLSKMNKPYTYGTGQCDPFNSLTDDEISELRMISNSLRAVIDYSIWKRLEENPDIAEFINTFAYKLAEYVYFKGNSTCAIYNRNLNAYTTQPPPYEDDFFNQQARPLKDRNASSYYFRIGNCPTDIKTQEVCEDMGYKWLSFESIKLPINLGINFDGPDGEDARTTPKKPPPDGLCLKGRYAYINNEPPNDPTIMDLQGTIPAALKSLEDASPINTMNAMLGNPTPGLVIQECPTLDQAYIDQIKAYQKEEAAQKKKEGFQTFSTVSQEIPAPEESTKNKVGSYVIIALVLFVLFSFVFLN